MNSWKHPARLCLLSAAALILWGCGPSTFSGSDETKEPKFLIGSSRVNALDYQGAIEAFEQALEANPRSAAAHFELGWIYADKEMVPATAIYHYEKYLQLRPGAENAETIRQHIFRLKQELAKGVLPIPPSTEIQRQLEQLAEENRQLRDQLERLRTAAPSPASQTAIPAFATLNDHPGQVASGTRQVANVTPPSRSQPPASSTRQHRVQAGETPMAIARRYNVKVDSLLTANPGLNPKRMQVGQSLVIPGR